MISVSLQTFVTNEKGLHNQTEIIKAQSNRIILLLCEIQDHRNNLT